MSTVRPVPAPWKWTLGDPEPAVLSVREEVALLFFDPTGSGGPRDPERTGEAAQEARVLGRHAGSPHGMRNEKHLSSKLARDFSSLHSWFLDEREISPHPHQESAWTQRHLS